jgi:threonine/homoserine/homoserine lactone efflux protein
MLGIQDVWLFVLAGVLLNITPGPDFAYVVARSATGGWRAGCAAALGIGAGCFVHIVAAAVGFSALVATSSLAFTAVKIVGALYLCYVGLSMVLGSGATASTDSAPLPLSPRKVFIQGFLTNALNPKVALFFIAFVPQFIHADVQNAPLAFLLLGSIFNATGTAWNLFVAWLASRAQAHFQRSAWALWLNRCIGGVFVAVGVKLAFTKAS